ncbi:phage tail protein, P2 protein I family [Actinokineospora alba]|uniref:Phage tail protein, P2 protein I family n=1 Tax=Actinokineospora alba TaxID=504798 RepID=A0A1H0N0H5_9PSEU|nr:phage tail protein [Actinokineospora alba]TDP68512.1 phage tail P2-like protein [Actinokineospora alba]SDH80655.1 phage tail protein, P2 protein I family [Actinokineospora alba]SDO86239.1 phage tail protein, P2 protein I family [Actinokineospora alba]
MRGLVPGLVTAAPMLEMLPAVYQEDPFTERFMAGFDDVVAPVLATLDCLVEYFDPLLAPEDFLEWLSGWVGIELDEGWPIERRRAVVGTAVEMYRMRGTVAGLRANLEVLTGGNVEIADSGGVAWSRDPAAGLPGEASPRLAVRVRVEDPEAAPLDLVEAAVAAAKPAHVVHRVEVGSR